LSVPTPTASKCSHTQRDYFRNHLFGTETLSNSKGHRPNDCNKKMKKKLMTKNDNGSTKFAERGSRELDHYTSKPMALETPPRRSQSKLMDWRATVAAAVLACRRGRVLSGPKKWFEVKSERHGFKTDASCLFFGIRFSAFLRPSGFGLRILAPN
jgi:hypothetical protein